MSSSTYQGRKKTKNGVKRLVFSALSILLQLAFFVILFTRVNRYAEVIDILTRLLAVVLVERVKAGVEVRVFYDDMGSIGFINTEFVKKMRVLGIECRVFNPFFPGFNVFLNNRDHRKITVIDGRVGFTGGYNLANEYFNVTHPYGIYPALCGHSH